MINFGQGSDYLTRLYENSKPTQITGPGLICQATWQNSKTTSTRVVSGLPARLHKIPRPVVRLKGVTVHMSIYESRQAKTLYLLNSHDDQDKANIYTTVQIMSGRRLPLLPDFTGQNLAHDSPVSSSARLVPLGNLARLVLGEDIRAFIVEEDLLLDLVPGHEHVSADLAVEEVTVGRTTELDVPRSLAAEDDHVGEVASPLLNVLVIARGLAEGSA